MSHVTGRLLESEMQNANRTISLVKLLPTYLYICGKREFGIIWMKKQSQHKVMKGPSKSLPNLLQIRNLEGNISTFEQIDELQQSPDGNSA
jgi:hypothetical protein